MISQAHVRTMARYNQWQNRSIYCAADTLTSEARRLDRGAFFKSIEGTLCHLLWGDRMWLHRFAGTPKPEGGIAGSASHIADWGQLKAERTALDETMLACSAGVSEGWLAENLTWVSSAANREFTRPNWQLVAHFFNHQTHHRGQVHAMLTAAGAKPDDTDLMLMTGEVSA